MDRDSYLAGRHVEQAAGFNDFQTLVEHRGRVDRNAAAHHPRGMFERLLRSDRGKLIEGQLTEWPTGGCKPDALDLGVTAYAEALVYGVVLTVDGQDGHIALTGSGGEDLACCNHAFLVGEAHRLAGENRGMRRFKTCNSDNRGDNEIGLG